MNRAESRCVTSQSVNGLYAITPDLSDTQDLLRRVELVLQGGAGLVQYRNKTASAELRATQAAALHQLTRRFSVPLIINDDFQLAHTVGAEGVHLGANDGSAAVARAVLGQGKLIGVSCYNRKALAQEAMQAGADYIAFGAFFPSSVKPDAVRAEPELLQWARRELDVPLVAIGGITLDNGRTLVQAGANALAVISAVFDAAEIQSAAREFSTLISRVQYDISQSGTI